MSLAAKIQPTSNFEKIETLNGVSKNYYKQAKIVFLISIIAQSCLALLAFSLGFPFSVTAYKIFTAVCVNTISCVINNILCSVLKRAYSWIANDAEMRKIWNNSVDRHNCFFIKDSKYPSSMKMSIALSVICGIIVSSKEHFTLNGVMLGNVAILSTLVFSATQVLRALSFSPQESLSNERENLLQKILKLKENFSSDLQVLLQTEQEAWKKLDSSLKTNIGQIDQMRTSWLNAKGRLESALKKEEKFQNESYFHFSNVQTLSKNALLVKRVVEGLLSNTDVPAEKRLIFRINMENKESDFFLQLPKLIILHLIMSNKAYPTFVNAFRGGLYDLEEKFSKLSSNEQEIIKKGIWANSRVENLSKDAATFYKSLCDTASDGLLQDKVFNEAVKDYLKSGKRKF